MEESNSQKSLLDPFKLIGSVPGVRLESPLIHHNISNINPDIRNQVFFASQKQQPSQEKPTFNKQQEQNEPDRKARPKNCNLEEFANFDELHNADLDSKKKTSKRELMNKWIKNFFNMTKQDGKSIFDLENVLEEKVPAAIQQDDLLKDGAKTVETSPEEISKTAENQENIAGEKIEKSYIEKKSTNEDKKQSKERINKEKKSKSTDRLKVSETLKNKVDVLIGLKEELKSKRTGDDKTAKETVQDIGQNKDKKVQKSSSQNATKRPFEQKSNTSYPLLDGISKELIKLQKETATEATKGTSKEITKETTKGTNKETDSSVYNGSMNISEKKHSWKLSTKSSAKLPYAGKATKGVLLVPPSNKRSHSHSLVNEKTKDKKDSKSETVISPSISIEKGKGKGNSPNTNKTRSNSQNDFKKKPNDKSSKGSTASKSPSMEQIKQNTLGKRKSRSLSPVISISHDNVKSSSIEDNRQSRSKTKQLDFYNIKETKKQKNKTEKDKKTENSKKKSDVSDKVKDKISQKVSKEKSALHDLLGDYHERMKRYVYNVPGLLRKQSPEMPDSPNNNDPTITTPSFAKAFSARINTKGNFHNDMMRPEQNAAMNTPAYENQAKHGGRNFNQPDFYQKNRASANYYANVSSAMMPKTQSRQIMQYKTSKYQQQPNNFHKGNNEFTQSPQFDNSSRHRHRSSDQYGQHYQSDHSSHKYARVESPIKAKYQNQTMRQTPTNNIRQLQYSNQENQYNFEDFRVPNKNWSPSQTPMQHRGSADFSWAPLPENAQGNGWIQPGTHSNDSETKTDVYNTGNNRQSRQMTRTQAFYGVKDKKQSPQMKKEQDFYGFKDNKKSPQMKKKSPQMRKKQDFYNFKEYRQSPQTTNKHDYYNFANNIQSPQMMVEQDFYNAKENRQYPQMTGKQEFYNTEENRQYPQMARKQEFYNTEENRQYPQMERKQEFYNTQENRQYPQMARKQEFYDFTHTRQSQQMPKAEDYYDFKDTRQSIKSKSPSPRSRSTTPQMTKAEDYFDFKDTRQTTKSRSPSRRSRSSSPSSRSSSPKRSKSDSKNESMKTPLENILVFDNKGLLKSYPDYIQEKGDSSVDPNNHYGGMGMLDDKIETAKSTYINVEKNPQFKLFRVKPKTKEELKADDILVSRPLAFKSKVIESTTNQGNEDVEDFGENDYTSHFNDGLISIPLAFNEKSPKSKEGFFNRRNTSPLLKIFQLPGKSHN